MVGGIHVGACFWDTTFSSSQGPRWDQHCLLRMQCIVYEVVLAENWDCELVNPLRWIH